MNEILIKMHALNLNPSVNLVISRPLFIQYWLLVLFSSFSIYSLKPYFFSRMEKKEPNVANCIKLLLNHLQNMGNIGLMDLRCSIYFEFDFSFHDYLPFLSGDFIIINSFVEYFEKSY